ncbi:MAG: DegT/DnrJ/EryC1/StrS family aminotransferase [Ktedonobacteraceae bacterium]
MNISPSIKPTTTISAEGTARRLRALSAPILALQEEILSSGNLLQGPHVAALEQAVRRVWNVRCAVGVASGTAALEITLRAAGVHPGQQVIVPAHTFVSTASAVADIGAIPVFVDIDPSTYTIDPRAVRAALTAETAAIIAVHLYGQPAEMATLRTIAAERGIVLIEDASQAHGATYRDRAVGSIGDFGCFSLYCGKNIGGLGDSGLITVRQPATLEVCGLLFRLRDLGRLPGRATRYQNDLLGKRARMREEDAAVILLELGYLDEWTRRRQAIAEAYTATFAHLPVQTPTIGADRTHVFYKYALLAASAQERKFLADFLETQGIETEQLYPLALCDQPVFQSVPHAVASCDIARDVTSRVVCLPIYPELSDEELARVITAVEQFYCGRRQAS